MTLVLVIITIVESALPGAFLLNGAAANFGVPWVSLSVSLNVILTAMICGRLLMMRRMTLSMMTPEMGNMYTGVMSILVESALPFSVVGLGFVVTYAKSSPTSNAFAYVWGMFCVSRLLFRLLVISTRPYLVPLSVSFPPDDHLEGGYGAGVVQGDSAASQRPNGFCTSRKHYGDWWNRELARHCDA